jgi:hypothetical protein
VDLFGRHSFAFVISPHLSDGDRGWAVPTEDVLSVHTFLQVCVVQEGASG